MKRASQFLLPVVVAFLLCLPGKLWIAGNAHAQEKASRTLPTAEMQRLAQFYVGTWDYTEIYPKSASSPQGAQNTGGYASEVGPGGNSLVNRFHSHGPVGDFEGMLVMTWDTKEKAYKEYVFGNGFRGRSLKRVSGRGTRWCIAANSLLVQ